jgi:uncharacterized metal-binding protein
MTKSFEEFEVYKKGNSIGKLVFKLLENKAFEKNLVSNQIKEELLFRLQITLPKDLNIIVINN